MKMIYKEALGVCLEGIFSLFSFFFYFISVYFANKDMPLLFLYSTTIFIFIFIYIQYNSPMYHKYIFCALKSHL